MSALEPASWSIDAARRRRQSGLVWLALAAAVATACGGGSPAAPASAVITSIAILGVPTAPISPGQSAPLRATATYSDGEVRDVTSAVSWGSSSANVLVVSLAGFITAVAPGEAQITATSSGVSGRATVRVSAGAGGVDVPFQVAVLLSAARVPPPDDVARVFARAGEILFQRTGERMTQSDLANVGPGSALSQATGYVNAHASSPPDGVLAFSDDSTSTTYGGYSQTFNLPPPNQNPGSLASRRRRQGVSGGRRLLSHVRAVRLRRIGEPHQRQIVRGQVPQSVGAHVREQWTLLDVSGCARRTSTPIPTTSRAAAWCTSSCTRSARKATTITTEQRSPPGGPACPRVTLRISGSFSRAAESVPTCTRGFDTDSDSCGQSSVPLTRRARDNVNHWGIIPRSSPGFGNRGQAVPRETTPCRLFSVGAGPAREPSGQT